MRPVCYSIWGERVPGAWFSVYVVQLYILGKPTRGWFRLTFHSAIAKGEREVRRAVKRLSK